MPERIYTQHERTLLLAALLDLTVGDFQDALADPMLAECGEEVDDLGGKYIDGLLHGEPQLMFQAVATMADVTLHEFVSVFGTDPLD